MPKIDGSWYCDICGLVAEYHRSVRSGHEYYCFKHWGQGDLTLKQIKSGCGIKYSDWYKNGGKGCSGKKMK